MMLRCLLLLLTTIISPSAGDSPSCQEGSPDVTTTRESGGKMNDKSSGVVVNEDSSLELEWMTVHDPSLPADLWGTGSRTAGLKIMPDISSIGNLSSGLDSFNYFASGTLQARESISAFEIRFLTFDVWGEIGKVLSFTEVADVPKGATRKFLGNWTLYPANDAETFYASLAFIARLRTSDGRVVVANLEPVLAEARKFSAKITAEDLEPTPAKK